MTLKTTYPLLTIGVDHSIVEWIVPFRSNPEQRSWPKPVFSKNHKEGKQTTETFDDARLEISLMQKRAGN